MQRNNLPFNCKACPSREFEISPILKANFGPTRFIATCHAKNIVLNPILPDNRNQVINRENFERVQFEPVENCPHIENLIKEGILPWPIATIDFLKGNKIMTNK